MQPLLPSDIEPFYLPQSNHSCLELYVKRDDAIHPEVSGNKYRKLLPNIQHAIDSKYRGIITFGGTMSNHIYATAAACSLFNVSSIGIIRGEENSIDNPTLSFAKENGMRLYFVSRSNYRKKEEDESIQEILNSHPDHFLVPEGGDNKLGMNGCISIVDEIILQQVIPDYIMVTAGTGSTAAGILKGIHKHQLNTKLIVISSLNSDFHTKKIIDDSGYTTQFEVLSKYHHGGYAKVTAELADFMNNFHTYNTFLIDPIYNGKTLYALQCLVSENYFPLGSKILHIHTGGLQGLAAYQYLNKGPSIYSENK